MEWFEYREQDLMDLDKQKEIFIVMLRALEKHGDCREVFHALARVLFNDSLDE